MPAANVVITLHEGEATAKDIRLYGLAAIAATFTTIYLYAGDAVAKDIILRDPTQLTASVGFPTQYSGLKIRKSGSTIELCLVATADAPAGMGGQPRLRRTADTLAVYLVETGDANASPLRIRTSAGTKSVRLKT